MQQPTPPGGWGPQPGYGYQYPAVYGAPPPGHVGWAIVAVIFFWPLAIPAFISYSRVNDYFYRGDIAGSMRASGEVKRYGAIALAIGIGTFALFFLFLGAVRTVQFG